MAQRWKLNTLGQTHISRQQLGEHKQGLGKAPGLKKQVGKLSRATAGERQHFLCPVKICQQTSRHGAGGPMFPVIKG